MLVAQQERRKVDAAQASAHHPVLNKPKTILIADDSAVIRTIIRQAIERDTEFVVCGEAVDGTEAVSKARELAPDLIILDVRMPGLNGMEVAGILRYALPHLRIALVTMYAEDLGKNFTSLFRIDAVLAKANGLTELTAHIRSLLANRQPDVVIPGETLRAV
jgi:DNA-binding NarL/FixJ family response regulator